VSWLDVTTQSDFKRARRKAFLAGLLDMVLRRPGNLIPFDEVRQRLNIRGQRYLGHRIVPVSKIVGSEGRYADFDRRFLPRRDETQRRWRSIDGALRSDVVLPPVELYKLDDIYFVKDGNHRVSVAREIGQMELDAYVTELLVDVPLTADIDTRDLLLKEEYSDFLEWTGLHALRPDERIEFSELGGYLDLVQHINAHRYYMGLDQKRDISREEAVISWYDTVYLPIVQVIRDQNVLSAFPGRTETDLYRWIMEHRWYLREQRGEDPSPSEAASHYLHEFGRKGLTDMVEEWIDGALTAMPWLNRDSAPMRQIDS
jgi:hypothetical protein